MPKAKEKAIRDRLEEIKAKAAGMAANAENKVAANLAEEAASLALELADMMVEEAK